MRGMTLSLSHAAAIPPCFRADDGPVPIQASPMQALPEAAPGPLSPAPAGPPRARSAAGRASAPGVPAHALHVAADHPQRAEVEAFIARIYRERHGARLAGFLPHLLAWRDADGALQAAAGLRAGSEGALFVEQYLDVPAEAAVAAVAGAPVSRERLVEVGNFAAEGAGDARALILRLTVRLHAAGYRWVLFAATRQLRNAFDRMHLATVALADADPARLAQGGTDWGRYYDAQPTLMCGDIAAGYAWLARTGRLPAAGDAPVRGDAVHANGLQP